MRIDSIIRVENRIAEIQSRLNDLTGQGPVANTASPGTATSAHNISFAQRLSRASASRSASAGQWESLIQEASQKYGVDAGLIRAVIQSESGGNPGARSSAGAMGLMQLMPATARSLGVTDAYDPRQNILGGTRYLRGLLDRLGSPELALAGYNAGPGAVQKYGGIPPYAETRNYVATVMRRWQGGGE